MVGDDLLDPSIGAFISERKEDSQSAIGGIQCEVAGVDRGIENDRGLSRFVWSQRGRNLVKKTPPRIAESCAAQLGPEPSPCMHHVISVDEPAHDQPIRAFDWDHGSPHPES